MKEELISFFFLNQSNDINFIIGTGCYFVWFVLHIVFISFSNLEF